MAKRKEAGKRKSELQKWKAKLIVKIGFGYIFKVIDFSL